jgi:hypothetical protein
MSVSRFGLVLLATLLISGCASDAVSQSKSGGAFHDDQPLSRKTSAPAENPNSARQYGLLISFALQRQGSEGPEQFRTLWFIIDGQGARIEAEVDGILLPRATGFWLAGIAEAEVEKNPEWHKDDAANGESSIFETSEQYPYAVPVGQKPPTKKIPESSCSEHWQAEIEFVGPDFVAYDKEYSRECGMGANNPFEEISQVLSPIDALTQQVKLFDYFSPDERHSICGLFSKESVRARCVAGKIRFGVANSYLKWTIVPEEQYAGFLVKAIPVPLPSKIVGYSVHFPSDVKARQAVEKAAGDGLLSPDCEWVFSLPGYVYRAYHPGQAPSGDADLRPLPFAFAKVVLAQWAMGSHVQDWDQKIKALPQSKD